MGNAISRSAAGLKTAGLANRLSLNQLDWQVGLSDGLNHFHRVRMRLARRIIAGVPNGATYSRKSRELQLQVLERDLAAIERNDSSRRDVNRHDLAG